MQDLIFTSLRVAMILKNDLSPTFLRPGGWQIESWTIKCASVIWRRQMFVTKKTKKKKKTEWGGRCARDKALPIKKTPKRPWPFGPARRRKTTIINAAALFFWPPDFISYNHGISFRSCWQQWLGFFLFVCTMKLEEQFDHLNFYNIKRFAHFFLFVCLFLFFLPSVSNSDVRGNKWNKQMRNR